MRGTKHSSKSNGSIKNIISVEASQYPWTRGLACFIMGRDPVELAKRAKYQPPAMRVRGVCYTKKSPFRYNEVVQAEFIAKGKVILMANKANSLAHTK